MHKKGDKHKVWRIAITDVIAVMLVANIVLAAAPDFEASPQAVRGNPIPGETGYGVELGLDPTSGKILELLVTHGQKQVQALRVCTPNAVPRQSPVGSIYTTDHNFDGHGDLALETAFEQGNASYCIWLYNPKTGRFVFSEELSRLTNPSPDAKTHSVISYVKEDCSICYRRESFRWAKGQLVPVREESVMAAALGLQLPTGCGWLRTVREEKNGKMVFVSQLRSTVLVRSVCREVQLMTPTTRRHIRNVLRAGATVGEIMEFSRWAFRKDSMRVVSAYQFSLKNLLLVRRITVRQSPRQA